MSGLLERLPTAHLLPIVARTENSALPFKRQLWTKYLIPRGRERPTTGRAAWTYCRAPESLAWRRAIKNNWYAQL